MAIAHTPNEDIDLEMHKDRTQFWSADQFSLVQDVPAHYRVLDVVAFKGASQPKPFYGSVVPWGRETKRPRHFDENVQELSMEK